MALGDIYRVADYQAPRPSGPRLGAGIKANEQTSIQRDLDRLGSVGKPESERDNDAEFAVDSLQKMAFGGAETVGGVLENIGASRLGETIKDWGRKGVEEQEKDIREGDWRPDFAGSFLEQEGFANKLGYAMEQMVVSGGPTAVGLAGAATAAAAAAVSAPAAAAILGVTGLASAGLMAGEMTEEQREKGLEPDYNVSAGVGALAGALEAFGIGKMIPRSWLAKATVGELQDRLIASGEKEAAKHIGRKLMEKGLTEAITEDMQEGLMMGSTALLGGQYTKDEIVNRLVDAAVVGGAMGTTIGGAGEALGKFGGAATKGTPLADGEASPKDVAITQNNRPGQGPRQLSLFGDEDLPDNATRNEAGEIEVVNPVTSAPVINKKLNNMLKFIATLEARKRAEPQRADSLNEGIRNIVTRMDKLYGQTPDPEKQTGDDVTNWLEAKDIVKYYRSILNKEKKASTAKAKREARKQVDPTITPEQAIVDDVVEQRIDDAPTTEPVAPEAPKPDRTAEIAKAAKRIQERSPITEADLDALDQPAPVVPTQEPIPDVEAPVTPVAAPTPEPEAAPVEPEVTTLPEAGPTLAEFAQTNFNLDVAKMDEWTDAEKSKVTQAWTNHKAERGEEGVSPGEDRDLRSMDTVMQVPQGKQRAKKPPKDRSKKYREESSIPEGSVLGKNGSPYGSPRVAATQLSRKGLKETHEVVKLGDKLYVLAPRIEGAAPVEGEAPARDQAASSQLQAVLSDTLDEGDTGPTDLAIEDADDGVSVDQAAELQSRWTSFMASEKGKSDWAKQWMDLTQKFLDSQGIEMGPNAFAEADWENEAGRNLYKTLVNTLAGRRVGASVLKANQRNDQILNDSAARGMADVQAVLAIEEAVTEPTLTVEEQNVAEATEVQIAEDKEAIDPPVETKAEAKATPATPKNAPKKDTKGRPAGKTMSKSALMRFKKGDLMQMWIEVNGRPEDGVAQNALISKSKPVLVDEIIAGGGVPATTVTQKPITKKQVAEPEGTGQLDEDISVDEVVDRDAQIAEEMAQKPAEIKKEEVIDTRAIDIKKDQQRIKAELDDYKEEGYTDEDDEVIALKEQRRVNYEELKKLGAVKGPTKRVRLSDTPGEIPMEMPLPSNASSGTEEMLREYDYPVYLQTKMTSMNPDLSKDLAAEYTKEAEQALLEHDPVFLNGREDITWLNGQNIPGFEGWTTTGWVEGPDKTTDGPTLVEVLWTDPTSDNTYPITTWIEADASLGLDNTQLKNAALRASVRTRNDVEPARMSIKTWQTLQRVDPQDRSSEKHYEAVKEVYNDFMSRVDPTDVDVYLVKSMHELPPGKRDAQLAKYPSGIGSRGLYYPKSQWADKASIYIIANSISSPSVAADVLLHELVGHHGFHSLFGNDWSSFMRKSLNATPDLFQKAWKATETGGRNPWRFNINPVAGKPTIQVELNGQIREVDEVTAIGMMDEYLAIMAQKFNTEEWVNLAKSEKGWFLRIKAWIKHKIRSFSAGAKTAYKLTDTDIMGLLSEYYGRISGGEEIPSGAIKPYSLQVLLPQIIDPNSKMYIDPSEEAEYITDVNEWDTMFANSQQSVPEADVQAHNELMTDDYAHMNKSYFGQKYEDFISHFQKKFPKITQFLNPNERLNNANMKRVLINKALGSITRSGKLAERSAKTFRGMSELQKQQAYAFFKDPQGEHRLLHTMDTEQQDAVDEYKRTITEMGQDLVDLGLLRQETFDKNRGAYLHVNYLKYLARDYKGASKRTSLMTYLKQKDPALTPEEKTRLGNLEKNVEFIVPDMLATIGRDVALLEYTKQLVNVNNSNPDLKWILPNSRIVMPDGREYGMFQLSEDLELWRDIVATGPNASNTEEDIEKLRQDMEIGRQLLTNKENELKVQVEEDATLNEAYKKLPNDAVYGSLAGEYVARVLYNEMTDNVTGYNPAAGDNLLEKFFDPDMLANKAHQWWKQAKVPLNPPSWIRNAIGNLTLLDLSTSTNIGKLVGMVGNELANHFSNKNSVWWERAIDRGMFGTTFSTQEIYGLKKKWEIDQLRAVANKMEEKGPFFTKMGQFTDMFQVFADFSNDTYGLLEGSFKTVAMKDWMTRWENQSGQKFDQQTEEQQGKLLDEAALHANQAIFDYSDVPQWLRMGRRSIIGAPFMTYTYKAAPAVVRGFANNPQKFLKYMIMPYALTSYALTMGDLDDEDLEEFRRRAPKWMSEKTGVHVLPWKDANGNMQAMDFGYYFPWSPWMDLYKSTNANWKAEDPLVSVATSAGNAATNLGFLGGPLPSMINGIRGNVDAFTGREIVRPGATSGEQISSSLSWLWTMWTPSMIGSTGVFSKVADRYGIHPISSLTGGYIPENVLSLNKQGRPRSTAGQDVIRGAGVNVYSVDPTSSHQGNLQGFAFERREVMNARSKMMKNRNIAAPEKVKRLREYNKKLHRVNARRAEYLKGGF